MKNKQKARRRCAWVGAVLLCILTILPVLFVPAGAEEPAGPLTNDGAPLLKFRFNLAPGVQVHTPMTSYGTYNPAVDTALQSFYLTGRDSFIVCRIDTTGYHIGQDAQSEYCTFNIKGGTGTVCGISVTGSASSVTQTFLVDVDSRYCVWGDNTALNEPSENTISGDFDQVRISLGSFHGTQPETKTRTSYGWLKLYKGTSLVGQYKLLEFSAYYYLNEYFRCHSNTVFSLNDENASDADSFVSVSSPALLRAFAAGESSVWASGITKTYYDKGFAEGYNGGLSDGYKYGETAGMEAGYAAGEKHGFAAGQTDAINSTSSLKDLIFSIFSAPADLINGILDFNLFGINLASLVKTLITLAVTALIVVFLIKLMRR